MHSSWKQTLGLFNYIFVRLSVHSCPKGTLTGYSSIKLNTGHCETETSLLQ